MAGGQGAGSPLPGGYMDLEGIGKRVRMLRTGSGMNAKDVAEHLGITKQTMSYIERGRRPASEDLLGRLADFYSVTLGYLLYGDEERQEQERARAAFLASAPGRRLSPIERGWVQDWKIPSGTVPSHHGFMAYIQVVRDCRDHERAESAARLAAMLKPSGD
jgi:transcriptional regulator with XRE-family HTH domain